jgi:succinate dehydrogenase / fumarate reductase membrane anchor subunit
MNLRNPLARVKGLGASGEGSHHWWAQRVSAMALIPLTLWFVFAITGHIGDSYDTVVAWISQPAVAVMLVLYLGFMFLHAQLGLQVVIEDYVHTELLKIFLLLVIKALALVGALASIFSILRLSL